ncbi:hypothetical protein CJ030_MR5G023971 [Morella rubra]|uniref:Uncharacterized protein n=1 Tax=Morella rubra TaxID=262757 RepID=A0A6A1VHT8_9ROSI|nr:hypothetical protein CJ030_MR5G023971 [Morella rubra]
MILRNRSVKIVVILKNMTPRTKDDVMPAGGKRLRCDSSVRAESSPGTLAVSVLHLGIETNYYPLTQPVCTQSSCASTSGIKHVQGSTRGIALLKARTGGKLTFHILDGRTGGDDKASSMLSSHIGALVQQHVPFDTSGRSVQDAQNRMFQHYSVFNSKEEALEHPYPEMNKEEWTRVCDLFASEEFQRRSAINKENKAKLKIVHTSERGLSNKNSKSDEITVALLYKKTHTNKDGMWTSEDARENFVSCNIRFNDAFVCVYVSYVLVFILFSNFVGKNEALQLQYESEGKSYTEVEIFAEVLGTKAGYVRGLGRSVRSVGSSSSVSSVDLSRKLEEARLQIEEMRARQLEYEALLVKRSDMEQTMREHLQMMEEQQRKKDEELMQMMAEQQRKKRRRAPEDDGGAAKDPSGTTRMEDATNGGADA